MHHFPTKNQEIFWGRGTPLPEPHPLGAFGASIKRRWRSVGPLEKILATGLDPQDSVTPPQLKNPEKYPVCIFIQVQLL